MKMIRGRAGNKLELKEIKIEYYENCLHKDFSNH